MPDNRIDSTSSEGGTVEGADLVIDNVAVAAELTAVIVAVTDGQPRVLTIEGGEALPSGPFEPGHRSLQAGMRSWVETQTHHPLGYVEQLYTFADQDRKQGTLIVHNLHFEPVKLDKNAIKKIADAIRSFAEFNQCREIIINKSNNKPYVTAIKGHFRQ